MPKPDKYLIFKEAPKTTLNNYIASSLGLALYPEPRTGASHLQQTLPSESDESKSEKPFDNRLLDFTGTHLTQSDGSSHT